MTARHWPTELRLSKDRRTLTIRFEEGAVFEVPAELLRVHSPSAEVQGHSAAERKTVPGKRHVGIGNIVPVGNYAVRLVFDDGHDTGLFNWDYLFTLGRERDARMEAYFAALAEKGLSRD